MLLMAASLIILLQSTQSFKQHSQAVLNHQLPQMLSVMEVEQQLNLSLNKLNSFIITGDERDKTNFHAIMIFLAHQFSNNHLLASSGDDNHQVPHELFQQYRDKANQVIAINQNDLMNYQGIARAAEWLNPLHQQFIAGLDALIDNSIFEPENTQSTQVLHQLIKTHNSWINMIMSLRVYFSTRANKDYDRVILYREQNRQDIKRLDDIKELMGFDAVFIDELLKIHTAYMEKLPRVLAIYANDTWRMDTYLIRTEIYPITKALNALLTQAVDLEQEQTSKESLSLTEQLNQLTLISQISFAISLLIGFIAIHIVARNIKQMVHDLDKSQKQAHERSDMLQQTSDELANSLEMLKNTQRQLVENEKMAALGNLVAGMAHEINTPIGVGVTASSHMLDRTNEIEASFEQGVITKSDFARFIQDTKQSNEIMLQNLRRAAELVGSFKQVAVDQSSEELRNFELCKYLKEVYNSLIPKLKKTHIQVQIDCPDRIEMQSYPGAVAQVITNLIMNSLIHGFAQGHNGQIVITANRASQSRVSILYKDNGRGMEQDTLNKIFDPFFTTNRGQGGSGLGMHLLYNLITQKLLGTVAVTSTPKQGVTFTIEIPQSVPKKS